MFLLSSNGFIIIIFFNALVNLFKVFILISNSVYVCVCVCNQINKSPL